MADRNSHGTGTTMPLDDAQHRPVRCSRLALAATVLAVPAALLGLLSPGLHQSAAVDRIGQLLGAVAAAVVTLLVAGMLEQRSRQTYVERAVWRRFSLAFGLIGLDQVLRLGLRLADGLDEPTRRIGYEAVRVFMLLACSLIYQGLVRWNRFRTTTSDPGDWLNGISATCVLAALGGIVVHATGAGMRDWPLWELQGWLLQVGAVVVLLGTAATVGQLGGLQADRRLWMVAGGFAVVVLAQAITELVAKSGITTGLPRVAGLMAVLVVGWAARRRALRLPAREATSQSAAIGSLVVLLAAVGIIAAKNWLPGSDNHAAMALALGAAVGVSTRVVHIVRELSLLAQTRQLALTDELTEVANRRSLMLALAGPAGPSGGTDARSLLVLDLDRFKHVNDRLGHSAGDRLLREIAGRLAAALPPAAVLARLGGDEFAVLLNGARADEALRVGTELAAAVGRPIQLGGYELEVGGSIGVAVSEPGPNWADAEELMRQADTAMYQAKVRGGGVELYDRRADAEYGEQVRLGDELRSVLQPAPGRPPVGSVVAFFQPQVDLRTGQVVGAEALVRWHHPDLGLLTPDRFLELVDERGLMPALTGVVLRQAATAAERWRQAGQALRVSVNLSAGCLTNPTLLPLVDAVLAETKLPPELLVLEVTETGLMADPAGAIDTLREIGARHVGVSIDDYGTGYSSLAYLNTLPADELKLDRSFTAGLLQDPRTEAIVATTIELAHRLGLRLVAEGVEDEETLRALHDLRCDHTQGYLHGRPLPVLEFEDWLFGPAPVLDPADTALRAS